MEQKIYGVHHIAIKACNVEDYEKTIHFYHEILGMPVVRTWGSGSDLGAMLDTGAGMMEIFSNGDGYPGQGAIRHMAFAVKDVDGCIEAVRAAGYQITMEPKDIDVPDQDVIDAYIGPRDIRDKYLSCSFLWDLGLTNEFAEYLKAVAEE